MERKDLKPSVYGINNASLLKRFAAWLIDMIIIVVLATGFCSLTSIVVKYDDHYQQLEQKYLDYGLISANPDAAENENPYISCEIKYDNGEIVAGDPCYASWQEFYKDSEAVKLSQTCDNLMLVILSVGSLLAVLIVEFVVPLLFKNGQTLGKKIMHIALMGNDGIKIRTWMLFARTIIGRYVLETIVPIYCVVYAFINPTGGLLGVIILIVLCAAELLCVGLTTRRAAIHDLVGGTISVDADTQFIARNKQDLEARILQDSK